MWGPGIVVVGNRSGSVPRPREDGFICLRRQRGTIVTRHLAAAAAALFVFFHTAALGAEHLVMPYACRFERGRVTLAPSPERSYPILGARAERPFTWCAPGAGPCRIRMVHRFDLSCDGVRVPWLSVAAAAARQRAQLLAVEHGRVRMASATRAVDMAEECGVLRAPGEHDRNCRFKSGNRSGLMVANLPAGFAPLNDLGARIVFQPTKAPAGTAPRGAEQVAAPAPEPVPSDPAPSATARVLAQSVAPAPADRPPLISIAAADPVARIIADAETQQPRPQTAGWDATVVEHAEIASSEPPPGSHGSAGPIVLALVLGSVLAGVAWQGHRHLRARFVAGSPGSGLVARAKGAMLAEPDQRACHELGRTVEQLLQTADDRLGELTSAAPLRGVLRQELDLVRHRLAESLKLADGPRPAWRQLRTRLQAAIRELHRIVRFTEGAIASFADSRTMMAPKSREEAYDVLGVNADVSDAVLKKLVDALRMSWHPDLAKNENDRVVREERTKVINVAWDLVCGKRAEA